MSGKPQKLKLTFGENQIAEQNLSISGLTYSSMAFEDEELTIGAACSAELGVELLNFDGGLSSFNFDGTEFTASIGVLVGEEYEYVPLGVFISEKPDKLKPKKISITAHDRMVKFDVSADTFLNSLSYPTTLKNIFTSLCAHVGVPASMADFPNSGKTFDSPLFRTQDVLCREVLQWIAEAACSFARISRSGVCELAWFTNTNVTFNKTANSADYYNAVVSEYQVAKIDKLQVAASEKDIGVIVGTGTNAYQIIDCPMLYGYTDAQIRPYAQVIYNRLNSFAAFTPVELDAKGDWSLEAGDLIKAVTDDGTYTFPIYRMDLTFKGRARIQYISSGSPSRPAISAENRRTLIAGRAAHEIEMTVEGMKQTVTRVAFLTPVESDTDPSLEWDDDQKTANTGYQWYNDGKIKVWTGSAWQTVISPKYNQTATPTGAKEGEYWYNPSTKEIKRYTGSAWVVDNTVCMPTTWTQSMQTQLEITAEGLSSTVTKDNIISTINQSSEAVSISASKINLNGVVTANNNFKIDTNGKMTCVNATISGSVTTGNLKASGGTIAGFTINGNNLTGNGVTLYGNIYGKLTLGAVDIEGYTGLSVKGNLYAEGNLTTDNRFFMTSPPSASGSANTRLVSYSGGGGYSLGMVSSSIRYKKEIHDIREYDSVSDRIDRVRAVTYTPKSGLDKGRYFYGFIAEELETEFPWLVDYQTDKGTREVIAESVEYDRVPAILWADAQATHSLLRQLDERIKRLEQ
jgi:hypothetical protein